MQEGVVGAGAAAHMSGAAHAVCALVASLRLHPQVRARGRPAAAACPRSVVVHAVRKARKHTASPSCLYVARAGRWLTPIVRTLAHGAGCLQSPHACTRAPAMHSLGRRSSSHTPFHIPPTPQHAGVQTKGCWALAEFAWASARRLAAATAKTPSAFDHCLRLMVPVVLAALTTHQREVRDSHPSVHPMLGSCSGTSTRGSE